MDDLAIKKYSKSDIIMPRTQEALFLALAIKSEILTCFLLDESIIIRKMSDATEFLQQTRNKL